MRNARQATKRSFTIKNNDGNDDWLSFLGTKEKRENEKRKDAANTLEIFSCVGGSIIIIARRVH